MPHDAPGRQAPNRVRTASNSRVSSRFLAVSLGPLAISSRSASCRRLKLSLEQVSCRDRALPMCVRGEISAEPSSAKFNWRAGRDSACSSATKRHRVAPALLPINHQQYFGREEDCVAESPPPLSSCHSLRQACRRATPAASPIFQRGTPHRGLRGSRITFQRLSIVLRLD